MASLSTCTYRIWLYTSSTDPGGSKGQLSLCLGGVLGSKWLIRVDAAIPSEELYQPGRCEFFQEAEDVGTLQSLTIEYGSRVSDHSEAPSAPVANDGTASCAPWHVSHVIVRNATSGQVTHFPLAVDEPLVPPLTTSGAVAPSVVISLEPRLLWHEDRFGNTAEQPPPPPTTGRWYWPQLSLPPAASRGEPAADADAQALLAEYGEVGISLMDAICREEMLPMIDRAAQDIRRQRTPGTFTFDCTQAMNGVAVKGGAQRSVDDLRRKNLVLLGEVEQLEKRRDDEARQLAAQLQEKQSEAEKLALALSQEKRQRSEAERALEAEKATPVPSSACAVL